MKKNFFAALAACFICLSCSNNGTSDKGNGMREKNLASSDAVSKAFETGDVSKIDGAVAADFIDHTPEGDKKGLDSLKATITMMHSMFKTWKTEKVKQLADDDYVFTWNRYSGTSDGNMGMPKGPFTLNAVEVVKFKDGKCTEHWSFDSPEEMMKMMAPHQDMGNNTNTPDSGKTK